MKPVCFYCSKPSDKIRCDDCKTAVLTSKYSMAKKLEMKERIKGIDLLRKTS